jgi:hypothetical protein
MPWLSPSLWQCTGQPSPRTIQTSWPSPRWLSTHRSVGHLYITSNLKATADRSCSLQTQRASNCIGSTTLAGMGMSFVGFIFYLLTHQTQVATVASTCILWASHFHDALYGPKSAHVRQLEEKDVESRRFNAETPVSTPSRSEPSPAPPKRLSKLSAYKSGRWNPDR